MSSERDLYYVAVKVFLEKEGNLLILKDRYGDWDLPGGRLQKREFSAALEKVIERKVREELGPFVKYRLGRLLTLMRHERREAGSSKKMRIFAIGYRAKFLGGKIILSRQHTECRWFPIRTFRASRYFKGGWLKGVEDYLAIRRARRIE